MRNVKTCEASHTEAMDLDTRQEYGGRIKVFLSTVTFLPGEGVCVHHVNVKEIERAIDKAVREAVWVEVQEKENGEGRQ